MRALPPAELICPFLKAGYRAIIFSFCPSGHRLSFYLIDSPFSLRVLLKSFFIAKPLSSQCFSPRDHGYAQGRHLAMLGTQLGRILLVPSGWNSGMLLNILLHTGQLSHKETKQSKNKRPPKTKKITPNNPNCLT